MSKRNGSLTNSCLSNKGVIVNIGVQRFRKKFDLYFDCYLVVEGLVLPIAKNTIL